MDQVFYVDKEKSMELFVIVLAVLLGVAGVITLFGGSIIVGLLLLAAGGVIVYTNNIL